MIWKRAVLLVLAACTLGLSRSVLAQPMPPGASPRVSTTFTPLPQSVSDLLNSGWSATAFNGTDGEFLLLVNGRKVARCELFGSQQGQKLSYSKQVGSICEQLN